MANFIKIKYFFRGTESILPAMYKEDILFPKYEHYLNIDTVELVTPVKKENICVKIPYSSTTGFEKIEIFMVKTVSNNIYFCLEEEFNKFIKEEVVENVTI